MDGPSLRRLVYGQPEPANDADWYELRALGRALGWPHWAILAYVAVLTGRHPEALTADDYRCRGGVADMLENLIAATR